MLSGLKSVMDKASKTAEMASKEVSRGVNTMSADAEIAFVKNEIDNLKIAFGREAFDLAAAGDVAAVGNLAQAKKPEMDRLQTKLAGLQTKKASYKEGRSPSVPVAVPSGNVTSAPVAVPTVSKIQATVPEGAKPGSTFAVQLPDGNVINATVPPGAVPGQVIMIDVPSLPAVVQAVAVV